VATKAEKAVKQAMGWNDEQLKIFKQMGAIVRAMNAMAMDDLEKMQLEVSRDEVMLPLIDPTKWRDTKSDELSTVKTVVKAVIDFKKAVSGIGVFHDVNEKRR